MVTTKNAAGSITPAASRKTFQSDYQDYTMNPDKSKEKIHRSPVRLQRHPDQLPKSLKRLNQWCIAGENKEPLNPSGYRIDVTNPANWLTFTEVVTASDSVGFILAGTNVVTIDVDHCVHPDGTLSEVATELLELLPTYTEFSQSQMGLHFIFRDDDIPTGFTGRKGTIEIYYDKRYVALTGWRMIGTPADVITLTGMTRQLLNTYFPNTGYNSSDNFLKEKILNSSFDVFDRQVLSACIAEQLFGNKITTINAVWKNMSGEDREPEPVMRSKILWSIEKMSLIRIRISLKEAFEKLQSLRKNKLRCTSKLEFVGYLLPCEIAPAVINNSTVVDAIKFLDEIPLLYEYSSWKKQAYTIDSNLICSPSVKNTELGLTLKSYILLRINEIKRSGNSDASSILLNTLINYCIGETTDRKLKHRIRRYTYSYLEELVNNGEINNFLMKDSDNNLCELKNCTKFCINVTKFTKTKKHH